MLSYQFMSESDFGEFYRALQWAGKLNGIKVNEEQAKTMCLDLMGYGSELSLKVDLKDPEDKVKKFNHECYRLPQFTSTGDTVNRIIREIIKTDHISKVMFGVRPSEYHDTAITILIDKGDSIVLCDDSALTVETTPRELEVLEILEVLSKQGGLHRVYFIPEQVENTFELSTKEAVNKLLKMPRSNVFPMWRNFIGTFKASYSGMKGVFNDQRWERLAKDG